MGDALFVYGIVSVIGIVFYFVFFNWAINHSPTGDSTTNWNSIKSNVFMSWIAPVVAILCSFISLFYLSRYPDSGMILVMGIACIAVGLSVASLSYALMSR